jgi:DNA replication protein DnaD
LKKNNVVEIGQAERNARKRDFEKEEILKTLEHFGVPQENINEALSILSKSIGNKELYIGTKRSPQSRVRFAQSLQNNWEFLRLQKYFTSEEKVFLTDIKGHIGLGSNCIVDDVNKKNPSPLNQTEIANLLNTSKTKISRVVNGLIKKGVIAKAETGVENNNVRAYSLFVNPNILISGDKENVNETLKAMFKKTMNKKPLKDLPDKLF